MKKLISVLLSVMMILQMGVVALAEGEDQSSTSSVASTVLTDANGNAINWISDMEVVQVGARTVAYVGKRASDIDTGVFAFDITDIENPVLITSKAMGTAAGQIRLEVFDFNGKSYLQASGSADGTKVWRINADATLEDGVAASQPFLNSTRDMASAGNTVVLVGPQINGNTPATDPNYEVLQVWACEDYLFGSGYDYSEGGVTAVGAREIGNDIYIAIAVTGKLNAGALVEGEAAEASTEYEHFIEIRRKKMRNGWVGDVGFSFELISRERVDVELGSIKFADDDTLIAPYCLIPTSTESVGYYKTEIDLDAVSDADVMQVTPVVTGKGGLVVLPLNDDLFALGSRIDEGYLAIYNEETGEIVYEYLYPDNRPSALAKFNGNIYSVTENGCLYVHNYEKSKTPAYEISATYKEPPSANWEPTRVGLLDGDGNRLSPANAWQGEMTGKIKVAQVGDKIYAYVVKRVIIPENVVYGIYVYDVTNYGSATHVQTVPFEDTTGRNIEIDILEVDDGKFLAVNETSFGSKYLLEIGADGTLSQEPITVAWANYPESDLIAVDNWLLVSGEVYEGMGIHLYRYNGKNADVVLDRYINIPVTDGAVIEMNARKDGDTMYIAARVDVGSSYMVNIYKVSLKDFTSELIVSKDMTAENGNAINGFEFIDNDTVLVSIFTNGGEDPGVVGLGIMEFDEDAKTAEYTALDSRRSTVALQALDETGKIMLIEQFSGKTSVAVADVYAHFEPWTLNPYRWWNNNNYDSDDGTFRMEDGLVYKDVIYSLSLSGDLYLWKLDAADVSCDGKLSSNLTLNGEIYGYQSGDTVSIYLAGKDYTATVAGDGTFTSEEIDIYAGETQNGAVTLIRGGSIAAMRDIQVTYAGENGAILEITSVKDSEGNEATGFTSGTMTLNAKVVTESNTSKKAILAVYEGGVLKNVYQKEVSGVSGQVTFEFAVEDAANTTAKLMLWESIKSLYPLVGAEDVEFNVNF